MNLSNPADDSDFTYDTVAEADAGYAHGLGAEHPDRAWILSDRDCWYPNPYYTGLPVPHPDDYEFAPEGLSYQDYLKQWREAQALKAAGVVEVDFSAYTLPPSDDCPF